MTSIRSSVRRSVDPRAEAAATGRARTHDRITRDSTRGRAVRSVTFASAMARVLDCSDGATRAASTERRRFPRLSSTRPSPGVNRPPPDRAYRVFSPFLWIFRAPDDRRGRLNRFSRARPPPTTAAPDITLATPPTPRQFFVSAPSLKHEFPSTGVRLFAAEGGQQEHK